MFVQLACHSSRGQAVTAQRLHMGSLLVLGLAQAAVEPSCQGHRYGSIDWDDVRSTLEIYADKYMDRPQLLTNLFNTASAYAWEYHPNNECILGDLSLRLLFWLLLDEASLVGAVSSLKAGSAPQSLAEQMLDETYTWFWDLKLSWAEIMSSGWPVFSLLASVGNRVRDEGQDACVPADQLQIYVDSFDNAIYVPAHVDVSTLADGVHCADAVGSALASLADGFRTTRRPAEGNRYHRFTSSFPENQPSEDDAEHLLARAEQLLRRNRGWGLMTTRWPLWRLLDRLSAHEVVNVTSGHTWFWMHVFPHRVRSDGLISNRIRATSNAYCLQLFQAEVLRLAAESPPKTLRLVEAGPHIGDCMLWASASLGDRVRALAVEPVPQVVSLFRRSIAANNFDIDLHHAWLGRTASPPISNSSVPWLTLDSLVNEDVSVMKIHTNGGERAILDGAAQLFATHRVRVVIVHSAEAHELWGSAEFLLERGYDVTAGGRRLSLTDGAWLQSEVENHGGLQLHATS
eukprot:TRINITY_DN67177_c0_g1_i1.p1 TRINITY_DN67177_c0_g1~~TRINITY_DN67177_c0_g1_i1.p1  ORF type:complete len:516 (+),score=59.94 TRINITY_DN67177_c0_g1_i1:61-1608(+)